MGASAFDLPAYLRRAASLIFRRVSADSLYPFLRPRRLGFAVGAAWPCSFDSLRSILASCFSSADFFASTVTWASSGPC